METGGTGLWLVGAGGNVASTVALGLCALRRGRCAPVGLVSELPEFARLGLEPPGNFILGGHETRATSWVATCAEMHDRAGVFEDSLLRSCRGDLQRGYRAIRAGIRDASGGIGGGRLSTPRDAVERLADDIIRFQRRHRLKHTVVINLASSEAIPRGATVIRTERQLDRALLRRGRSSLPPSTLYALAAIDAGCAYVNFTPSMGADVPAVRRRAEERGLPCMGRDGKTGETLVKSVLAPLFAWRNLRVLSWVGYNVLGNRDGRALSDANVRAAKLRTKDRAVRSILGAGPHTHVGIDFVPSLDDWKTAWDFIHFEGFLSTRMSLQFCWQGCDSLLAAPLVIDLARFAALALRRGESGPMRHLACFFKDPMGVNEQAYDRQWTMLCAYAKAVGNGQ